ncbi:sialoadhesin [Puntigrus tetrazona]|uniref:sialoadhesin n=1 Tax=Puntigrus tetrazona TaxID=1606681 RepID=UPI001C8A102C|nr:sialoadhesin [Puntigrus tetrazona]
MALDALIRLFSFMSVCVFGTSPGVSLSVPERVLALEGSCLVIPCSFRPDPGSPVEVRLVRSSSPFFMMLRRPVFSSERGDAVHPSFRDRAALAGNVSAGDCSVSFSSVRRDDHNTYELQLRERGQRSWPAGRKVNVSVTGSPEPPELSDPGPVTEGQRLVLNCSARVSCPSDRPRLSWSWSGSGDTHTHTHTELQPDAGRSPRIRSSLSFTVRPGPNPRVHCELQYPDHRRSSTSRQILVQFAPRDVGVQVLSSSVRLGGNALLLCSCKADPPVSEYQWWSNTQILKKRSQSVRIFNISRDTLVQCSAANRLGQSSSPKTRLNVLYAPVIESRSWCVWDGVLLSCLCAVDSNPRPAVTWSVNGTQPPDGFNTSSSYENETLTARLRGVSEAPGPVECHAVSELGNHSLLLLSPRHDDLMWTVIPSAGAVSLLLLLLLCLLLCFCRCRTRRRSRVSSCGPPPGVYQERMPLYINCSEVTNVYSNGSYQLIYQNCTPLFVRSKQLYKRQRRGARRQRVIPVTTDSDTAVYVEVI